MRFLGLRSDFDHTLAACSFENGTFAVDEDVLIDYYHVEFIDGKGEIRTIIVPPSDIEAVAKDWTSDFKPLISQESLTCSR